jgi:hypothetical protein
MKVQPRVYPLGPKAHGPFVGGVIREGNAVEHVPGMQRTSPLP